MDGDAITFPRRDEGRVVAGVAAGFSRRHGVDVAVVRGALVVLTFAAGIGLVVYAAGSLLSRPSPDPRLDDEPTMPVDVRRNAAVVLITLGLLSIVRSTGLWLGDQVMVPLGVLVAGVVVLAMVRTDDGASTPLSALIAGRHARARITVGAVLVSLGLLAVGVGNAVSSTVRVGVFAAAVSILGIAMLVGPWIAGLAQAAAEEHRQRIRSEEREAMAAHLHDSVLQTLALIQRSADDPRRTAALARQQEHELRSWLYGGDAASDATLASAVTGMARDVEQRHDVRIEVVTVGDAPMTEPLQALLAAAREACVNAATHSGETSASVYLEVAGDTAQVFVRDRGVGFDPADTATDRMGIAQSMVGRLERVGGAVRIHTSPGNGTEVEMSAPLGRADAAGGKVVS
ncbi:MAG: PspC domain-containing protein [Ilumatobacteraceae bacterium]